MVEFLHTPINTKTGDVVEIKLSGNAANVLLLDEVNYQNYKRGRSYKFFGGHYKQSPVRITPPHAGKWHVVVNLGGARGRIGASIRVVS